MKHSFRSFIIGSLCILSFLGTVLTVSCNRDRCKDIVCANGGVCNIGNCTCPTGYQGSNCEIEVRKKFTGNWSILERGSTSLTAQYQVSVQNSTATGLPTDLQLTNFNNHFKSPVRAYAQSTDTIIIPNQTLEGYTIYGYGVISSSNTYVQYGSMHVYYMVINDTTLRKDDYGYESFIDFSDPSAWNK